MPCYECPTLCCGMTCQDCRPFATAMSVTTPSSPASEISFSFDCTSSLKTTLPALENTYTPDNFANAAKQSRWDSEPSTKTSRFNWSEMTFSTGESAFDNFTANHEDAYSSLSDAESEYYDNGFKSNCPVCSMVPYGAVCSKCDQIQTSRATVLATPPAAAWPNVDRLGDWEETKKLEEELLQDLDMELFEQINVPHELDEWGRRVYNDCGHRIIYCVDEDGNTVMGYEAWYPSSVTGDYEEPDDWRAGRQPEDSAAKMETEHPEYNQCGHDFLYSADSDEDTVVGVSEAWYPMSVTGRYEDPENWRTATQDEVNMVDFEQQRLAEFLAAQNEELPKFKADRERIAAWIATSSATEDEMVS